MKYDSIVVGAGIAGIATAFFLRRSGQKVLLVDKKGPLAGASGAAGAFLSPRLGKGGDLQKVTNDAYRFALSFYAEHSPDAFFQKGLVRIPKNEEDAEKFAACEPFIDVPYEKVGASRFPHIDPEALKWGALWFADAAFVDPMGAAKRLLEGVETRWGVEARPRFANGVWHVEKFAAPNLVLATGAANLPVALPWLSVGGVWGERVDVRSDAEIPVTLHQKLSVSANVNGVVRIGATHVRNDPRSEIERVNQLIVDAVGLVPALADQRIVKIYAGHRASVPDHLPVVGPVPDIAKLAARYQRPPKSLKPGDAAIDRIPGLYLVNGFGGRGFVFGPRMGSLAAEAVAKGTSVPPVVSPDRFALRYLRKR